MKYTEQFKKNIAKIDTLTIGSYERDVIRSAYYNHLNNIPIASHALALLKQYGITFYNGDVRFSNMDREERKKLYKRRDSTETTDIYQKSFLQVKRTHSNLLAKMLADGEKLYIDTQKLINDCIKLTHDCFMQGERSHGMTINMIEKLERSTQTSMQAFANFLQPFLELFDGLQPQAQKEILEKSSAFMQKIQKAKDTSAALCIKLSTIKAHHAMPKEKDFIQYLEDTIAKFDNYVK